LNGEASAKIGNQACRFVYCCGRVFDFLDGPGCQEILEAPDTGVPFRDLVPKPPLLPLHGIVQAGYLAFLQGQLSDVDPVRGADEVREHVDVAKRLRNQCLISRWVSEYGPVSPRNITCIGRGPPQGAQRSKIPGAIKPSDRGSVPFIEGLVQQL
jgi:hypothetical protein